ncbi:putative DNA binding domain-containing protein, partial [Candidatus Acetothermia bacterium]|nr:putative DNA binding domain-containing protein [Candidatus Acetothermia bacterium]
MSINKRLEDITENDLKDLVDNKYREIKSIDYKVTLPGNSDSEKKEFLADVSSFANANGGDLIYGIKANDGLPVNVCG